MANPKKLSNMNTIKSINDITIKDVTEAAQENSKAYCDHYTQKIARAAFIEGVMWAQKVQKEGTL